MPVLSGTRSIPLSKPLVMASGLLLLTAVSGCSMLEDRSERYVEAKEVPPCSCLKTWTPTAFAS